MNKGECSERIRLVDEYSRLASEFNKLLTSLKNPNRDPDDPAWIAVERARGESQIAWDAVERHMTDHRCLDLHWSESSDVLQAAAMAALDVILVADDARRYVDFNESAAAVLALPRSEITGRRIDEFFAEACGETIPEAWNSFIADGVQSGFCELIGPAPRRKFEYRAKANFAPGLHLSVLREVRE